MLGPTGMSGWYFQTTSGPRVARIKRHLAGCPLTFRVAAGEFGDVTTPQAYRIPTILVFKISTTVPTLWSQIHNIFVVSRTSNIPQHDVANHWPVFYDSYYRIPKSYQSIYHPHHSGLHQGRATSWLTSVTLWERDPRGSPLQTLSFGTWARHSVHGAQNYPTPRPQSRTEGPKKPGIALTSAVSAHHLCGCSECVRFFCLFGLLGS